jgi:hypothetical protein
VNKLHRLLDLVQHEIIHGEWEMEGFCSLLAFVEMLTLNSYSIPDFVVQFMVKQIEVYCNGVSDLRECVNLKLWLQILDSLSGIIENGIVVLIWQLKAVMDVVFMCESVMVRSKVKDVLERLSRIQDDHVNEFLETCKELA